MKKRYKDALHIVEATIRNIPFGQLPISDYNKRYIKMLNKNLSYHLAIEACMIEKLFSIIGNGAEAHSTIVDYGGGSGFMSLLAKQAGVQTVIYVDINPDSVHTVRLLKELAGYGPDLIIEGDSSVLKQRCNECKIVPDGLISADVIEHIYDLDAFFNDLQSINKRMPMVFSTGSNPENRRVVKRLHRMMDHYESGSAITPNYYTQRKTYIARTFPGLTEEQQHTWTAATRGMVYADIKKALESDRLPVPGDKHNTCDPATGNFVERILPFDTYREIADRHSLYCLPEAGFYNTHRSNKPKALISHFFNRIIKLSKKGGRSLSPFIFLTFRTNLPE